MIGIHATNDNEALERELEGHGELDADFVNLVTHVPMPARMRNELINRGYARMANRLGELLGASDDDAPPNFFCFAHWASSYVGTRMDTWRGRFIQSHLENGNAVVFHSMARAFLAFEREVTRGERPEVARRRIERRIPAAPRVNSDVDALVDTSSSEVVASLVDPISGLPPELVREISGDRSLGSAELLARIRRRGFDAYLDAIRSTDRRIRDEAILRGNAWLVISEQAMVDAALTRAMRSLVRTATRPVASTIGSRRRWRNRRVGPIRHGIEDAWIELLSKTLEWPVPNGVMADAAPLRIRPNGPASVHRWARTADADLPAGEPFDWFRLPDLDTGPLFWTSLGHRLPVIFSVLAASHDGPWFRDGRLREHPTWSGFAVEARGLVEQRRRVEPLQPDAQRRLDWGTAKQLFDRDRELILAALFTRALPATYTSPAGAALLDLRAHGLSSAGQRPTAHALADDSLPRLRMSAAFIDAMFMSPEPPGIDDRAMSDGRTKLEWLDGVAQVHEHVRTMIAHAVDRAGCRVPDTSLFDEPLGYEQCIGAGVSFVVPVIETLAERYGVVWSADERDSWSRVWAEITLHQGLDAVLKDPVCDDWLGWGPEAKPTLDDFSYGDFAVAAREVRRRTQACSLSGVRLADKLRRDLEDAVPGMLRPLVGIGLEVFGDPAVNRLLHQPEPRFASVAAVGARCSPALTRTVTRRFIRIVLRELDHAQPEPAWDAQFAPGFDGRTHRSTERMIAA